MKEDKKVQPAQPFQTAQTGNASNPSPGNPEYKPHTQDQLIPERGEKYLREVSNPEDYPDPEDEQRATE